MRARTKDEEIDIPEGRRFWAVDLGTEDEPNLHHFRMPRSSIACALVHECETTQVLAANPTIKNHLARAVLARLHSMLVGECWHNRVVMLETPPLPSAMVDFGDFAEKAGDELADRYDLDQLTLMGERAEAELRRRTGFIAKAAALAKDFIPAEPEAEALQEEAATPPSPEK